MNGNIFNNYFAYKGNNYYIINKELNGLIIYISIFEYILSFFMNDNDDIRRITLDDIYNDII